MIFVVVWSIATCCVKVTQLDQSLATTLLACSFNHLSPIPNGKVVSQPTQVSLCLNSKLVIQFEGCLLLPFSNALVINHILPQLPRTISILWHIRWLSKSWLGLWVTMFHGMPEMVRINHRCYINFIEKHGIKRQSLQTHFEFEFHCLNECLVTTKICFHCDSNPKSFEVPKSSLQTPR